METIKLHKCKICGNEKPVDQFYLRSDSKTLRHQCKSCYIKLYSSKYHKKARTLRKHSTATQRAVLKFIDEYPEVMKVILQINHIRFSKLVKEEQTRDKLTDNAIHNQIIQRLRQAPIV